MLSIRTLVVSSLLLITGGVQETLPRSAPAFDVQQLGWLAGTWEIRKGERITEEHWFPFKGSTMIGVSHTYDIRASRSFEFLRIVVKDDTLAYIAQPGGKPPVSFALTELDAKHFVFENHEHDHPQRIRYERTDEGMKATASLLDGSRAESFVFIKRAE